MRLSSGQNASGFGQNRPSWHIFNHLTNIDSFGKQVPGFNIKGSSSIGTVIGGFVTVIVLSLTLLYATVKTMHLIGKENPVMSSLTIPSYYNSTDRYYLNEANFRMAFSVEGYLDQEVKNDPEYVKWFVRLFGVKDSVEYEKIIPHHKCTEEDY